MVNVSGCRATVAADGRPVTVATWYLREPAGTILLGLDAARARIKHLKRDPRVSLTALAEGLQIERWHGGNAGSSIEG